MYWVHLGGGGLYQVSPAHPMLNLLMSLQGPHRQVRVILGAAESLPVIESISSHTEAIGLRGVPRYCTIGLAWNTNRLAHIGVQPKPFKNIIQDVKRPL